jgi:hypothetical protein
MRKEVPVHDMACEANGMAREANGVDRGLDAQEPRHVSQGHFGVVEHRSLGLPGRRSCVSLKPPGAYTPIMTGSLKYRAVSPGKGSPSIVFPSS